MTRTEHGSFHVSSAIANTFIRETFIDTFVDSVFLLIIICLLQIFSGSFRAADHDIVDNKA